jgi:hypothetical protein
MIMAEHAFLWMLLGAAVLCVLTRLINIKSTFRHRIIDDVAVFLRTVNKDQLQELFDAQREQSALRFTGKPRRLKHARLELAREYFRRMLHNAVIVSQWAKTEWDCVRHEPEAYDRITTERVLRLRRAVMLFRLPMLIVLTEIKLWSFISSFHWLPLSAPQASSLRMFGHMDLLQSYENVKLAAAELARTFGDEYADEILALM